MTTTVGKEMKKIIMITAAMSMVAASQAVTVAAWNFNSNPADASTSTGTLLVSAGSGTASTFGGVTSTFASGAGSSDLVAVDNSAVNTTTYAAQSTGSGTRGMQFLVSTAGLQNVQVKWDNRHSNTSSRFVQFQYTTNGTSFSSTGIANNGVFEANLGGDLWYNNRSVDLSAVAGVANNANFGFRVVSIFAPTTTSYAPSTTTSTYGVTGTLRFDGVEVAAEPVPEPASMLALFAGTMALVARKKRA